MRGLYELLKGLVLDGTQCVYCGREVGRGALCCAACEKEEEALRNADGLLNGGILYSYRYEGIVRSLIHRFKYGDRPRYALFIAEKMAEFLEGYELAADLVSYVPVHENRRIARGFDQSEMLAGYLATLLGLPFGCVLVRTRDTRPQFNLDSDERRLNIRGAFALGRPRRDVAGKSILLVDDIYTTGATVSEAMKPLAAAGAVAMPFTYAKQFPEEQ